MVQLDVHCIKAPINLVTRTENKIQQTRLHVLTQVNLLIIQFIFRLLTYQFQAYCHYSKNS